MSDDELLRLVFIYAEQDRETFVQSYPAGSRDPSVVKARKLVNAIREYRLKRWGRTAYEKMLESATEHSLDELRAMKPRESEADK